MLLSTSSERARLPFRCRGAPASAVEQLRQAELALDEPFLLVIVGEFNAGKSAFINALIGERVLREGVTPTTAVITRLRYAPSLLERREGALLEVGYPLELLRDVAIVDTPGTNAILREHEQITSHFVPRADLVLFVTSADRPFTETERALLEQIREWGKKIVVVVNKIDLLETPTRRSGARSALAAASTSCAATSSARSTRRSGCGSSSRRRSVLHSIY